MLGEGGPAPAFTAPMASPGAASDRGGYTGGHVEKGALAGVAQPAVIVAGWLGGTVSVVGESVNARDP